MSEVLNEPHGDEHKEWLHEQDCAHRLNSSQDCTCGDSAHDRYRKDFEEWIYFFD